MTDDGKHQADEIITRSHSTPVKQKKPSKSKAGTKQKASSSKNSSTQKFQVLSDLNLRPSDKTHLTDYIKGYDIKSNGDRIIVIIHYLKEVLKVDKVTIDHIYTAFFVLKCKIPTTFYQVVVNTKSRSKLLEFDNMEDIKLSTQGLNRVRLDIIKASK